MDTRDAVAWFGGVKPLAHALNLHSTSIYRWGDTPPIVQQLKLEKITKGKLRADDWRGAQCKLQSGS